MRLQPSSRLTDPAVQRLIAAVKGAARTEFAAAPPLTTLVKSISAKQRPRMPAAKTKRRANSTRGGRGGGTCTGRSREAAWVHVVSVLPFTSAAIAATGAGSATDDWGKGKTSAPLGMVST